MPVRKVIRVIHEVLLCGVILKVVMPRAEKASCADEAMAVVKFIISGLPPADRCLQVAEGVI